MTGISYWTKIHPAQKKLTETKNIKQQNEVKEKMAKYEEPKKPQSGAWEHMETEEFERKEQVKWKNVGDEEAIRMKCSSPKELPSPKGDGVFYMFDCEHDGKQKVILTSAWSLLKGLKKHAPLTDKDFIIKKEMKEGRQFYSVTCLDEEIEEETVEG